LILFQRPISAVLTSLAIVAVAIPVVRAVRQGLSRRSPAPV
jgi:TctA family transporter